MAAITPLDEIDLGKGQITKLRWSPDGRLLALPTQSGWVALYDSERHEIVRTIGPHHGWVTAVAGGREGGFMMTASSGRSIGLWGGERGNKEPFFFHRPKAAVPPIPGAEEEAYARTRLL